MVDADKHGDAAHDARPLAFKLVRLSKMAVQIGIQQPDHRCRNTLTHKHQQESVTNTKQLSHMANNANRFRSFKFC